MNGFEQGPSILAGLGTMLVQYLEGCVLGVVLGVILVNVARRIEADASWLFVPPVVSFVILPSVHASRVWLAAGVVATMVAVPIYGLKGPSGDFGIRNALEYRWVRLGVSLLAGFLLLQVISVVVLIVSAVIIGGLVSAWWNHGLRDFIEGVVQ